MMIHYDHADEELVFNHDFVSGVVWTLKEEKLEETELWTQHAEERVDKLRK